MHSGDSACSIPPYSWIVRTVDGREIEFSALRDLQAAIYDNRVTREDVLVRGSSRPRRLGSIAELEPFFNRSGMNAPNPQRRARTLAGAGAAAVPAVTAQRAENSVVFSLPNLMGGAVEQEAPVSVRRSTLPPPPPPPARRDGSEPSIRRASIPPATPRSGTDGSPPPYRRGSIPPPPPTAPTGRRPAPMRAPSPSGRFGDPNDTENEEDWSNTGIERISALPPPPPMPRRSAPPPPPMFPPPEPPPPLAETALAPKMFPDPEPTKMSKAPTPPSETAPSKTKAPTTTPTTTEHTPVSPTDKPSVDKPDATSTNPEEPSQPPVATIDEPRTSATEERASTPTSSDTSMKTPNSERLSAPGSAPLPSSRYSEPYSESRFSEPRVSEPRPSINSPSAPTASRRAGAARWIVAVVLAGCTLLAALTILPKLYAKQGAGQTEARVVALLDQGDRAANEGDLEAANEAFVKASALVDKDARVELRLARMAIVRADVPWLKVRLLSESDPDLAPTRRELVLAAGRALQAVERAQAVLPNDQDVTRCRIDVFRLQSNVNEARKLLASLVKPAGAAHDEVGLALLDMSEPTPAWPSIIERLSHAAGSEQNLGHARSMLIYALVQSGDLTRAKSELDQLVAMPRPHPLIGAFRAYIAAADKAANAAPAEDAGGAVDEATAALQTAVEATTNGEFEKAAELLKDLETRFPNNANVLTAAGRLALKKDDRPRASAYFEKALTADKNHFDALSGLADIKWDSGEKQAASVLYRRIIEGAGADSPYLARAKERFSAFTESVGEQAPE
ncbi:MAG TPA: hypothetical protein PK156_47230 [Polyangium sp.]|nr:hypothetical protein [Polyangium sp.]